MKPNPRHRFEALSRVSRGEPPPVDFTPDDADVVSVLLQKTPVSKDAHAAYTLYAVPDHRAVVDAFLLAGTDPAHIQSCLDVPVSVLNIYARIFFDVTAFRNKLEKISYAAAYDGGAYAKELLKTAVTVGPEYLRWMYNGAGELDTRKVVRNSMVDAFYRGMAHKGNSLNSHTAKEALRWWAVSIRNAEVLEKLEPRVSQQATDALKEALDIQPVDDTLPANRAPVPVEDILH